MADDGSSRVVLGAQGATLMALSSVARFEAKHKSGLGARLTRAGGQVGQLAGLAMISGAVMSGSARAAGASSDEVAAAQRRLQENIEAAKIVQQEAKKAAAQASHNAQAAQRRSEEARARADAAEAQAQAAEQRASAAEAKRVEQEKTGLGPKYKAAVKARDAASREAEAARQRAASARQQAEAALSQAEKARQRADKARGTSANTLKELQRISKEGGAALEKARATRNERLSKEADKAFNERLFQGVTYGAGITAGVFASLAIDKKLGVSAKAKEAELKKLEPKIEKASARLNTKTAVGRRNMATLKGIVQTGRQQGLNQTGRGFAGPASGIGLIAAGLATRIYAEGQKDEGAKKTYAAIGSAEIAAGGTLIAKETAARFFPSKIVDSSSLSTFNKAVAIVDEADAVAKGAQSAATAKRAAKAAASVTQDTRSVLNAQNAAGGALTDAERRAQATKKGWETRRKRGTTNTGRTGTLTKAEAAKRAAEAGKGGAAQAAGWSDEARKAAQKARQTASKTAETATKVAKTVGKVKGGGNAAFSVGIGLAVTASLLANGVETAQAARIGGDVASMGGVTQYEQARARGESVVGAAARSAIATAINFASFGLLGNTVANVDRALAAVGKAGRTGKLASGEDTARTKSRGRIKVAISNELSIRDKAREQAAAREAPKAVETKTPSPQQEADGNQGHPAAPMQAIYAHGPTPEQAARNTYMQAGADFAREANKREAVKSDRPRLSRAPVTQGGKSGFALPHVQRAAQAARRRKG